MNEKMGDWMVWLQDVKTSKTIICVIKQAIL